MNTLHMYNCGSSELAQFDKRLLNLSILSTVFNGFVSGQTALITLHEKTFLRCQVYHKVIFRANWELQRHITDIIIIIIIIIIIKTNRALGMWGWGWGGWVRQRCRVSYVTGASNWCWLTIGQGLVSLQQVRVEGECFYFFCFFTFIHFPLSLLSLSFVSSTISSISRLLSLGDDTKWPQRLTCR